MSEKTDFEANPIAYLLQTTVNIQGNGEEKDNIAEDFYQTHDKMGVRLIPWKDYSFFEKLLLTFKQVIFSPRFSANPGPDYIHGCYFPYIQEGEIKSGKRELQLLELPQHPGENDPQFAFTGGVNGCSPLILEGNRQGTFRMVHYPNSGGKKKGWPLLAEEDRDKVLLSLNVEDYGAGVGGPDEYHDPNYQPNGFAFFYHDPKYGQWTGIVQSQVMGTPDLKRGICSMSNNSDKGKCGVQQFLLTGDRINLDD